MRTVLANNITRKLEKTIKGKIKVSFSATELIVSITVNRHKWQYVEEVTDFEITHGMTSSEKAAHIYEEYTKYIYSKYFK